MIPNGDEVCEIIRLLASIDRRLYWVESAAWLAFGCLCGWVFVEVFWAWRERRSVRQYQAELDRTAARLLEERKWGAEP